MDNEEKYQDIRAKLQNLEQVKASDNFVHNLHHKIVEFESEKRKEHIKKYDEARGGFLRNMFTNRQYPWLVPAVGFTVLIFFVFYITFLSKNGSFNPQQDLSTKQENSEQKNSSIQTDKTLTQEPPAPVTAESEKTTTDKGKISDKNLASDFKTERKTEPPVTEKNIPDKGTETPKLYKQDTQPVDTDEKSKVSEPLKDEKKNIETGRSSDDRESNKEKMSSVNPEATTAPSESEENNLRGGLFEDQSTKRLREKIDSVSKIDLEKLRQEILK